MFKTTLKKKSSINIIPMIDVIFFLLVFFMLFTTFRTTPTGIDLQLPKAVTVSEQDSDNLIIDISENGDLYYENKKISINRIREIAATYYQNNNNTIAIINADEQVLYKDIIAVMDNLRQSGIYKLALAAEKKEY
ncbi:biopolymer transporter ExbD [Halocella sp. SP3-1]|nr:biopolymer transporter ExbD [Halocella sp. SP3-1]AZO95465.1 biopolymer transporter ExbD [Halocella sp. SP3-1]